MRFPALWLYLLGAVTFLVVVLRRVLHRHGSTERRDLLGRSKSRIDHVHSGVAWVRADGMVGSVNPALATTLRIFRGSCWEGNGKISSLPGSPEGAKGATARHCSDGQGNSARKRTRNGRMARWRRSDVLLVTIHDHKSRLVGHYCLMEDRSRELELEQQVQQLSAPATARQPSC